MNYDCSLVTNGQTCTPNAGISKFKFQHGKKHRLRLTNAGAEGIQRFTIDGHNMTVIANEFVPVKPYSTNDVTLGVSIPSISSSRAYNCRSANAPMSLSKRTCRPILRFRCAPTSAPFVFSSKVLTLWLPSTMKMLIRTKNLLRVLQCMRKLSAPTTLPQQQQSRFSSSPLQATQRLLSKSR